MVLVRQWWWWRRVWAARVNPHVAGGAPCDMPACVLAGYSYPGELPCSHQVLCVTHLCLMEPRWSGRSQAALVAIRCVPVPLVLQNKRSCNKGKTLRMCCMQPDATRLFHWHCCQGDRTAPI